MERTLYIETLESTTENPLDLVMLHGWAMHGGVMKDLAERLTSHFRVHLVDLPGHGLSPIDGVDFSLDGVSEKIYLAVKEKLKYKTVWLGWSLGGLISLNIAASHHDEVNKLILLSSNPAFVKKSNWPHAVDGSVFDSFANGLVGDIEKTIKRFMSLQIRGSDVSRETLKELRDRLFSKPLANHEALVKGLDILQSEDLRSAYKVLPIPVQLLAGESDTLVPATALHELQKLNVNSELYMIKKAGHAPFISHLNESAKAIIEFCHD